MITHTAAECQRIGDSTIKVPVSPNLRADSAGLPVAIAHVPREWQDQISTYALDRAYTDQAGQRWFLIKVVWRMA